MLILTDINGFVLCLQEAIKPTAIIRNHNNTHTSIYFPANHTFGFDVLDRSGHEFRVQESVEQVHDLYYPKEKEDAKANS